MRIAFMELLIFLIDVEFLINLRGCSCTVAYTLCRDSKERGLIHIYRLRVLFSLFHNPPV
jgi:hypothetical protein